MWGNLGSSQPKPVILSIERRAFTIYKNPSFLYLNILIIKNMPQKYYQPTVQHTGLKKHHKWMIGSFTFIVIVYIAVSSILIYTSFVKQDLNYRELNQKITDTQSNINSLSDNLIQTRSTLEQTINSLDVRVGTIDEDMVLLKASASEDFSGIIEDVIKSVVTIRTETSQGTGFIISSEGYLVTNAHVLVGSKTYNAITYAQETKKAELIGYDPELDLALLKIDGEYSALPLANSDETQIGEKVIAIGNPLGLQFSVSEGIVSAVHRLGIDGKTSAYTQTDAALNPGNSGGPLINKQGKALGINNFKIGGSENIGFALESNYIKQAVNEISQQAFGKILV